MDEQNVDLILKKLQSIDERLQKQDDRLLKLENPVANELPPVFSPIETMSAPTMASSLSALTEPVTSPKRDEEWTGRLLGKLGIIAVLAGVAFFLQYSWAMMGEGFRVILGIVGGLSMIGLGSFLQKKYLNYANLLSGGGLAILYLSIYYAQSISLIPSGIALLFMSAVTVLAGVLSIFGGTSVLAIVGVIGGFSSPFLIGGNFPEVSLLTYILFLDLAIVAISVFKKWIHLNLLGFVGTVLVCSTVGFSSELDFIQKMSFLTGFFLIYLISNTIHSIFRKTPSGEADLVLSTLNAAFYFVVGLVLIHSSIFSQMKGFFAVMVALVFFALAVIVRNHNPKDVLLNNYLPSLSMIFLTVAIPIQLDGIWITIAWLGEALAIFLIWKEVQSKILIVFGSLVYVAGLFHLLVLDHLLGEGAVTTLIANQRFLLFAIAIGVAYFIVYLFHSKTNEMEDARSMVVAFLLIANVLTVGVFTLEANSYFYRQYSEQMSQLERQRQADANYRGQAGDVSDGPVTSYSDNYNARKVMRSQSNTAISVIWAIYAILLLAAGFSFKQRVLRVMGMFLFIITAGLIFIIVWDLGSIYRIITSIGYGFLALVGSFVYAQYKDKLKEVV